MSLREQGAWNPCCSVVPACIPTELAVANSSKQDWTQTQNKNYYKKILLQISKRVLNCPHHTMIGHPHLSREQKKQDGRKPGSNKPSADHMGSGQSPLAWDITLEGRKGKWARHTILNISIAKAVSCSSLRKDNTAFLVKSAFATSTVKLYP